MNSKNHLMPRLSCIAGIESLKSKSWLSQIFKNIINKNYTINNLKKSF